MSFIVQASLTIITCDRHNILILQATDLFKGKLQDLTANTKTCWRGLLEKNGLAYLAPSSVTKNKRFMRLAPGVAGSWNRVAGQVHLGICNPGDEDLCRVWN
jgi:hypothetical protein